MNPLQPCDLSSNTRCDATGRRLIANLTDNLANDLCGIAKCLGEVARFAAMAAMIVGGGMIAGCTIPSDCGDLDYPTYGGAWQRTRRDSGRVGSVFDPAGARTATLSPRELPETEGEARSARDSILSSPPDTLLSPDSEPRAADDPLREPSPSDRTDPDKLRDLQLDEINIQRGAPIPPDFN